MLHGLVLLPAAILAQGTAQNPDCQAIARQFAAVYLDRRSRLEGAYRRTTGWFSDRLVQLIAGYQRRRDRDMKAEPDDEPMPEIEEEIAVFWDRPSAVKVQPVQESGASATVALLCSWGKGTQYPGDQVQMTLCFIRTAKGWRLDDIRTAAGKFVDRQTLSEELGKYQPE
jgi:hypothetical protein